MEEAGVEYGGVRAVAVTERHSELVRELVAWLESGPDQSAVTISKKGRKVTADFKLHGTADRVLSWVGSRATQQFS